MSRIGKEPLEHHLKWRHTMLSRSMLVLLTLVVVSALAVLGNQDSGKRVQAAGGFSFVAASDWGQTSNTTAVLNMVAKSGVNFTLSLGDLNYNYPKVSPSTYSSYVQSHLGTSYPFEFVAGNHDTGDVNQLASDLPNRLGSITGSYAKEYYFDYPSTGPLARFILVTPGLGIGGYNYNKGGADYNWVANAITSARAAGIPWVIVGIHEFCIVIGPDPCVGQALMNLLVSEKVDLILYGHKRTYQASKQLALNGSTCASLKVGGYNAACVVNATSHMTKGAGSVMVIAGTAGEGLSPIDTTDPETGYFRSWMGANVKPTFGVVKYTISATQLTASYFGVSGGNFTDSFTISG